MKHTVTFILTLCLLLSLLSIGAGAEEQASTVYVTIAVKGELVATQIAVALNDYDNDGEYTVNDALFGVHQQNYEGGTDAGYGYYAGDYGLSMSKLWGDESGMYGYYLNNASCMSLADPVKDGDHITAFVYKNADFSDIYTYFDVSCATCEPDGQVTLTLMAAGYDENWNPITYPVEGATLTFNSIEIGFVTDAEGKVTLSPEASGTHVFSAVHDGMTIVPPVCVITVPKPVKQGCKTVVGASLSLLLPLAYVCIKRKEN